MYLTDIPVTHKAEIAKHTICGGHDRIKAGSLRGIDYGLGCDAPGRGVEASWI